MFQERLDNGRRREVQRSCDTPTVERGSVGKGIAKADDTGTTVRSGSADVAAAALPQRNSSEARLPVPVSHRDSDLQYPESRSIDSSNLPWSRNEIEDLQRAMVEHGRVGAPINMP